jgi:hypothetical protein
LRRVERLFLGDGDDAILFDLGDARVLAQAIDRLGAPVGGKMDGKTAEGSIIGVQQRSP